MGTAVPTSHYFTHWFKEGDSGQNAILKIISNNDFDSIAQKENIKSADHSFEHF